MVQVQQQKQSPVAPAALSHLYQKLLTCSQLKIMQGFAAALAAQQKSVLLVALSSSNSVQAHWLLVLLPVWKRM
jgi:hypothetical protein